MGQKSHKSLGPGLPRAAHLRAGHPGSLECRLDRVGRQLRHLVLERFRRRERQQLALLDHPGNLDVGVHHRFGDLGRPVAGLRRGAEFLANVRDGFLVRWLGVAAAATDHGRGGADRTALAHDQRLAGKRDQRACRNSTLVHERDRPDPRTEQCVAHHDRCVHAAPESIDVEQHRRGSGFLGLPDRPREERREAEVDHSLDRDDVDDGCASLSCEMADVLGASKCRYARREDKTDKRRAGCSVTTARHVLHRNRPQRQSRTIFGHLVKGIRQDGTHRFFATVRVALVFFLGICDLAPGR